MEDSAAYKVGEIIGIIFSLGLMAACLGTFIVALVMSFKTRRKLWIVLASITGLPVILLLILLIIGFIIGFIRGFKRGYEGATHQQTFQWTPPAVCRVCLPDSQDRF